MTRFFSLSLLASAALIACKRTPPGSTGSADSSSATQSIVTASALDTAAGAAGTRAPCPRTGLWAVCSVEQRLKAAGFVLRKVEGDAPRRAGFSVRPVAYTLAHSRLEVFVYPSAAALSADLGKIDTATAAPRGAPTKWETAPILVHSANLAAVFLTENGTQAERLTLALTAGAPQR